MKSQALSPFAPPPAAGLLAALAFALGGCIVSPTHEAPIVERSQARPSQAAPVANAPERVTAAAAPREAHNGTYVVQAGDTLYSIALAFGQDYRDLARWNGLDDPTHVRVGQPLRVAANGAATVPDSASGALAEAVPIPVSPLAAAQTRPLGPAGLADAAAPSSSAPPPNPAGVPIAPSLERQAPVEPERTWAWPSAGKVVERFDETRNKGIDIAGSIGDPVLAANDGQVVYSGNGLRGYGNLVIIKHTDDYVSAYAHNNEILVTQGQAVKRGQRIAGLGMSDAPNPRLHFEIRRRGKPVDPMTYLPSR